MELIDGRDLRRVMKENGGMVDESLAVGWMKDVATGMLAAEDHGFVHRDLKSSNILVGQDGRAKVTDFGLALGGNRFSTLTMSYVFKGTPLYVAPEQAMNAHLAQTPADIYSFGATFYHALTGHPVFDGESFLRILMQHLDRPPIRPVERNPSLSSNIDELIMKCLAKDPKDRLQSFRETLEQLEQLSSGETPRLWVYKCNSTSPTGGHWLDFFQGYGGEGDWGGTRSTSNPSSVKILREKMQVGDLVLAWQTDERQAYGLCRVSKLRRDGEDIDVYLKTEKLFDKPVELLKEKKKSPALANGKAFQPGAGTLFETRHGSFFGFVV